MAARRKERIVLIGGGGHAKVIIDAILRAGLFEIYGIIDSKHKIGTAVLGSMVIGRDDLIPHLFRDGIRKAFISIGSLGDCAVRRKVCDCLSAVGFSLPPVVHPNAVVAADVDIGGGAFVAAGAIVNPGTRIGRNAIINTACSVDHDCVIGDFVHIAPGATLSGGVSVGDETHIGTGANIIQGVTIGNGCFVAAGATISQDMNDGERVARGGVHKGR